MSKRERHRVDYLVLAIYVLIGVVFTMPLPLKMGHCLAGDDIDAWLNPWVNWWTHKALSERGTSTAGLSLYYTNYLFYPHGASLVYHSFSHANTALWFALRPVLGNLPAHNLTILVTYPLSAFTLYLLAHHLTESRPAAFVAGFIFGFSPFHVAESAHPVLGTIQWIPLFMLSLERAITQRRTQAGVFAALWLWLTALSSWHLLVLGFSLGLCRAFYLLVTEPRWRNWKTWRILLIASAVFIILTLPFIWPLLSEQLISSLNDTPSYISAHQEEHAGTDLLAFFTPSNYHPLLGPSVSKLYARFYPGLWQRPAFIGYSVLVLGIIGILRGGRRARFWWITSLFVFLLALGPNPHVLGQRLFPYALPWGIPVIRLIRYAGRLNVLLTLCWSLVAAWGCAALLEKIHRHRSRQRDWAIMAGITLLIAFEYCPIPFPHTCVEVSPFYTQLAQEEGDFAIVEIPMGRQPSKISMFYQTIHERPLVGGHISRTPPHAYDFIRENELLSKLQMYSAPDYEGPFSFPFPDLSRRLDALAQVGIRYIVFRRASTSPQLLAAWQSFIGAHPAYEDNMIIAYLTSLTAGENYSISSRLTEELGLVESGEILPDSISQAAWLRLDLHWAALKSPSRDYRYRVTLRDSAGEVVATYDEMELAPGWPTSSWSEGELFTTHFANQIDPFLTPGRYRVVVEIINPQTAQAAGSADLGPLEVQALPRQYTRPPVPTETDFVFGDQIRLIGYEMKPGEAKLEITFYWQALRRMEQSYKTFVHLSPVGQSGSHALVTQYDGIPRNWSYPTLWWDEGEIVTDTITLDIEGVKPGRYEIAVGMYDEDTLKRLPVTDRSGVALPNRKLILPTITIETQ